MLWTLEISMKDTLWVFAALFMVIPAGMVPAAGAQNGIHPPNAVLVIHGGAGSITRAGLSEDRDAAYRAKLEEALRKGHDALQRGRSSLDAVVAAITVMEDSPLFNAGKGAVLTSAGTAELDASIMEGRSRNAGAVASIKHAKSPIRLARSVMEQSPHVMLAGEGAEAFAEEIGMEMVPNEYFRTENRIEQYERYLERQNGDAKDTGDTGDAGDANITGEPESRKYGTVGAAALDRDGNLAAGTSTGGTSFKKWGRIGDSPIIGAGTYADNATCAVSATGTGEYFIRGALAFRISAMMQYAGLSLHEAAASAIHGTLTEMGGDGGIIGLDREGNVVMTFNTDGMYRGYINEAGDVHIALYGDE